MFSRKQEAKINEEEEKSSTTTLATTNSKTSVLVKNDDKVKSNPFLSTTSASTVVNKFSTG